MFGGLLLIWVAVQLRLHLYLQAKALWRWKGLQGKQRKTVDIGRVGLSLWQWVIIHSYLKCDMCVTVSTHIQFGGVRREHSLKLWMSSDESPEAIQFDHWQSESSPNMPVEVSYSQKGAWEEFAACLWLQTSYKGPQTLFSYGFADSQTSKN